MEGLLLNGPTSSSFQSNGLLQISCIRYILDLLMFVDINIFVIKIL